MRVRAPLAAEARRPLVRAALIGLLLLGPGGARAGAPEQEPSRADVIASVLPAVVSVQIVRAETPPPARRAQDLPPDGPAEPPRLVHTYGSGFVIDPKGIIVTNRHVIENALSIRVVFADNVSLPASRIGALSRADVALLRVNPRSPLVAARLGDSDKVRIGDDVFAIGDPLGLGGSVSTGIVSALNRDIRTTPFDDFIQTDAAINHGNSGGPLFNRKGEVVGINTAIYAPTETSGSIGIGFALPINTAKFVIDQTLQYGRVRPGWLGLTLQSVTSDIADAVGLGVSRGTIVSGLEPGGPAALAGVEPGDVVLSIGQQTPRDPRALWRAIATAPLDQPIALTVWRNGNILTFAPVVREMPHDSVEVDEGGAARPVAGGAARYDPGFKLSPITQDARLKYGLGDQQSGLVVTEVVAGSPAAERGIVPGDVVLRAGDEPLRTADALSRQIAAARKQKRPYLLLLLSGSGGQRFVALALHPEG